MPSEGVAVMILGLQELLLCWTKTRCPRTLIPSELEEATPSEWPREDLKHPDSQCEAVQRTLAFLSRHEMHSHETEFARDSMTPSMMELDFPVWFFSKDAQS